MESVRTRLFYFLFLLRCQFKVSFVVFVLAKPVITYTTFVSRSMEQLSAGGNGRIATAIELALLDF